MELKCSYSKVLVTCLILVINLQLNECRKRDKTDRPGKRNNDATTSTASSFISGEYLQ